MASMLGYEPGPHIHERRAAVTTAPPLPPHPLPAPPPPPPKKNKTLKMFEMPKYKFQRKYDRLPTRLAYL